MIYLYFLIPISILIKYKYIFNSYLKLIKIILLWIKIFFLNYSLHSK